MVIIEGTVDVVDRTAGLEICVPVPKFMEGFAPCINMAAGCEGDRSDSARQSSSSL